MAYAFKVPSGDGGCVCEICDCSVSMEVESVPLASLTRDGWNGWTVDGGECRSWKTLTASAMREGTVSISNDNTDGAPCVETISGTLEISGSWTLGGIGDHYHCNGFTGDATITVGGQTDSGGTCVSISASYERVPGCADFLTWSNSPHNGTIASRTADAESGFGIGAGTVGWPAGCNVISAAWPYVVWNGTFLFWTSESGAAEAYDDAGSHFLLTPGTMTASSATYTMSAASTSHPAAHITLTIDDTGSVNLSLSDEWTVAELLDSVSTLGSGSAPDGFTEGSTPAISSLSADTLTATYRAIRYRFQYAPHAATVTWVEVTETYSPDTSGELVGSSSSGASTLNVPAATGSDLQYTDWIYIYPGFADAGYTLSVFPSITSSTCWHPTS